MFFCGFHFNRTVLDLILDIRCVSTLLSIVQGKINIMEGFRTHRIQPRSPIYPQRAKQTEKNQSEYCDQC